MFLKTFLISPVIILSACSSPFFDHSGRAEHARPLAHYARGDTKIIAENSVAATGNQCVDNFNFLRLAGDEKYQGFSQQYITVGNGYSFLNRNKNVMDTDARQVYTMKLNMKLDTLCSKVNYAGYLAVQRKIKELHEI